MGVEFKMSKEQPQGRPDVVVFHLGGWLDAQSEPQLVEAVQAAKDAGAKYVLLDMRDMDTITSAGIRAIHKAYLLLTPKDETTKTPRLKLCNTPPPIYQVLSITGLLMNVPAYENAGDAVASFEA
jgi:anti-anti-sigma factor